MRASPVTESDLVAIATDIARSTCKALESQPGQDDCACIALGDGRLLLLTVDGINTNPLSASLGIGTPHDIGRLCASASLSDLLGSGATPLMFAMAARLPGTAGATEVIRQICEGATAVCAEGDVAFAGGDTKRSASLVLTGCAVGIATKETYAPRDGAQVGDAVLLSGPVGLCAAGALLLAQPACPPDLRQFAEDAVLRPRLPWDAFWALQEGACAHGGIDISDGLGLDLHRLADASGLGLDIAGDLIPIDPSVHASADFLGIEPLDILFGLAGDWQFVVTCSEPDAEAAVERCPALTRIGAVVERRCGNQLAIHGSAQPLPRLGHVDFVWQDFLTAVQENVRHTIVDSEDTD